MANSIHSGVPHAGPVQLESHFRYLYQAAAALCAQDTCRPAYTPELTETGALAGVEFLMESEPRLRALLAVKAMQLRQAERQLVDTEAALLAAEGRIAELNAQLRTARAVVAKDLRSRRAALGKCPQSEARIVAELSETGDCLRVIQLDALGKPATVLWRLPRKGRPSKKNVSQEVGGWGSTVAFQTRYVYETRTQARQGCVEHLVGQYGRIA